MEVPAGQVRSRGSLPRLASNVLEPMLPPGSEWVELSAELTNRIQADTPMQNQDHYLVNLYRCGNLKGIPAVYSTLTEWCTILHY